MSKDLNKEYTDMIQSELPDLWERISASLPEKEIKTEPKKKTKIYRFGILAAACVCVAIIIPVVVMNGRQKNGASATMEEYATAAAAVEETQKEREMITTPMDEAGKAKSAKSSAAAPSAAAEDAAEPEAAGGIAMESAQEAFPVAAQAAEEAAAAEAAEPQEVPAMEEAAEAAEYDSEEDDFAILPSAGNAYETDQAFSLEADVLTNVRIRITSPFPGGEAQGLWLAEVLTAAGYLAEGEEILIQADEGSPEEFADSISEGIYTCSLEESETEEGEIVYLLR